MSIQTKNKLIDLYKSTCELSRKHPYKTAIILGGLLFFPGEPIVTAIGRKIYAVTGYRFNNKFLENVFGYLNAIGYFISISGQLTRKTLPLIGVSSARITDYTKEFVENVLVAPMAEELSFRKLMLGSVLFATQLISQNKLIKNRQKAKILLYITTSVLSAVAFTTAHKEFQLPPKLNLLIGGSIYSLLYLKFDTKKAVIAHMTHNFLIYLKTMFNKPGV